MVDGSVQNRKSARTSLLRDGSLIRSADCMKREPKLILEEAEACNAHSGNDEKAVMSISGSLATKLRVAEPAVPYVAISTLSKIDGNDSDSITVGFGSQLVVRAELSLEKEILWSLLTVPYAAE